MNKTEKSDFQNLATTIIGVVLFTSLMAIPFGEVAGVAYKASFQTLLGLNVVICLTLVLIGFEFIDNNIYRQQLGWCRIQTLWPILLSTAWICFSPTLDALEIQQLPIAIKIGGFWWAAWYTKLGVGLLIIGTGYAINYLVKELYMTITYELAARSTMHR